MTADERFWSRFRRSGDCLIWTGATNENGYGTCTFQGRPWKVHRLAYVLAVGPIPAGLDIDHVWSRGCRSRACGEPSHLEPVTRGENLKRGHDARNPDRERVCIHGHVGQMRRKKSTGGLECAECVRARDRRRGSARGSGVAAGERHYAAKLSTAQVDEIRRRAAAGETQAALAREFGITAPYTSSIVTGKCRRVG